jgi:LacI family gluconate utilization system Gnt-I transcriptional repressor
MNANSDAAPAKPKSRRASGRPTLADVADLAGVGSITVSRALRDPARVSAELRARIDAAVKTLGYVLNPNARALASVRSDVIGVLIPSMTNNVFADVLRGIHDGLGGSPLQIQFGNTHYSAAEEERLLRVFLSQQPSALIVSGIDQSPAARLLLDQAGCPVVQIMDLGPDPVDIIIGFSHAEGGAAVTRHLIETGRRRIAFLGARMDPRSLRRLSGYSAAMRNAGLFDDTLVTTTLEPSSVTMGSALFAEARRRAPDLDGVVCNNDDLALGVLFACQRGGIAVPAEVGIAGFNDHEMMAAACPSITSIRTPRHAIGRMAVQAVLAEIAGEPVAERVIDLGFELQVRESTTGF